MISRRIAIVTPVFNDFENLNLLLNDLTKLAKTKNIRFHIIVVDDGSDTFSNLSISIANGTSPINVDILRLACNLGHQRAIAIGLTHAFKLYDIEGVVVMDSDGEDRPEDIPCLIQATPDKPIVVASRCARTENSTFRLLYFLYKVLFFISTGRKINFGNFCYIPFSRLRYFVYSSDIWNHLAASVCRSKLPIKYQPCKRGVRYSGYSKMNTHSLIVHGLGAMSVFIDIILARMLAFLFSVIVLLIFVFFSVILVRAFTSLAIPGWTTNVVGFIALALLQSILILFVLIFLVLNMRSVKTVIPIRDSLRYVWAATISSSMNSPK